ncbi:LacI family DNA-binding transcriptional regulator [soil metagenome]
MPVGLKDVAKRARVSIKTASNVVNGYPHVRPATRERVDEAIAALGYRPHLPARSLRGGRTGVVALAMPDLTSPYFAEIARNIIFAAEKRGWTVLIDQTDGVRERELDVARGIRDHLVDGVIFSPLALGDEDLRSPDIVAPIVCLGERIRAGAMDHIAIDNVAAACTATRHLIERGRRRIAAIGSQLSPAGETARLRLTGYRDALSDAGHAFDPTLVQPAGNWHRADGQRAVETLMELRPHPDAVFCFNDLLALGALHGLAHLGLRVPEDVAVIGIDDIEDGRFVRPALTTIAPDKAAIAATSVALLAERLASPTVAESVGREVRVGFELVVREST